MDTHIKIFKIGTKEIPLKKALKYYNNQKKCQERFQLNDLEYNKLIDKLVKYMKERPELRVELSSHTDSRGSFAYNIKLSNGRSQSCVDYIISKGINKNMIVAKGYGETQLLNNCSDNIPCSEVDHQANRRTELKLLTPTNEELNNNQLDR
jgi:outer membrane protein OmpA-like peptidoglycan-associated protein